MKTKLRTGRFRARARNFERTGTNALAYLSLLAVIVGVVAGYGAIAFRYMIAFFHNLFFFGKASFAFDSGAHFVSSWGAWILLVPAIGLVVVAWLTRTFAPEARGHGVPEVMYAVVENRGRIRPVVALVKSLASAVCIGSGGSVGREGPIVQIGAGFGSSLGQLLGLRSRGIILLVGCGVAGGIAATFNAPIGGVAFAVELILPEYNLMTFMPLIVSSTTATTIAGIYLGDSPAFVVPEYHLASPVEFAFYLLLGLAVAVGSIAFVSMLYRTEDFFDRLKLNPYLKAFAGGLLLGAVALTLRHVSGHYYLLGVGYSFISDLLVSAPPSLLLVLSLVVLKIFATSLTLGAGGSGGVFAPSLFIGAAIGGAVGMTCHRLFPNLAAPASAYALVGMAAMVAGTTGATFTSIVMTFEMTRNYDIMLPLMLSVVVANYLVRYFYKETIYTKKLVRRGVNIQFDKLISVFRMIPAKSVADPDVVSVRPDDTVSFVIARASENRLNTLPVVDGDRVLGTIRCTEIFTALPNEPIEAYVTRRDLLLPEDADCMTALERMDAANSELLLIAGPKGPSRVVTKGAVLREYFRRKRTLM